MLWSYGLRILTYFRSPIRRWRPSWPCVEILGYLLVVGQIFPGAGSTPHPAGFVPCLHEFNSIASQHLDLWKSLLWFWVVALCCPCHRKGVYVVDGPQVLCFLLIVGWLKRFYLFVPPTHQGTFLVIYGIHLRVNMVSQVARILANSKWAILQTFSFYLFLGTGLLHSFGVHLFGWWLQRSRRFLCAPASVVEHLIDDHHLILILKSWFQIG